MRTLCWYVVGRRVYRARVVQIDRERARLVRVAPARVRPLERPDVLDQHRVRQHRRAGALDLIAVELDVEAPADGAVPDSRGR